MDLIDYLGLRLSIAAHMLDAVCVFVFCMLLSRLFVFVTLVTFFIRVLTNVFGRVIRARARV